MGERLSRRWRLPSETGPRQGTVTGAVVQALESFAVKIRRSAALRSLTLIEAYNLALKKSETVAMTAEEIHQAQARFYRSFDYFLPSVHFLMSDTYRDAPENAGGSSGTQNGNAEDGLQAAFQIPGNARNGGNVETPTLSSATEEVF